MSVNARDASRKAGQGIEWLARFGYAAKGTVYVVIGILSALAAFGGGGKTTGSKGAISRIGSEPFGQLLLVAIALGLLGYVVWRFTQAFKDPEQVGHGLGGIAKRIGFFISGLVYGSLAFYTARLLVGSSGGSSGHSKDSMTAELMSHPGGISAVAAIGAIIVGVGVAQFTRAYKEKFKRKWRTAQMRRAEIAWATRAAKFGLGARGVVFLIIGGLVIIAAWRTDPSKAAGLDGALDTLRQQPFGAWLLGLIALGLICYGIYCGVDAIYRRINP